MESRLNRLQQSLSVDLRSLGILRICLGLMILVDLAIRSVDLREHYTDFGILPRAIHGPRFFESHPGHYSFHMWSGELPLQAALFAVSVLFAGLLVVGYRTRLSLLLSWVLMISLQNRNLEIETGGDYLLRIICFWALFLPMGARFSLDRRAGRICSSRAVTEKRNWIFSAASVALIIQLGIVYVFSALHKKHPIWTVHDTAIHYALHIDAYDTWLGEILRNYPSLTAIFTRLTLQFEFWGILLLVLAGLLSLIPRLEGFWSQQGPLRTFGVLTFISFHLGLAFSLSLGTFPWFAALIWLGLFPTWTWDAVNQWRRNKGKTETPSSLVPFVLRFLCYLEKKARAFEKPRHRPVCTFKEGSPLLKLRKPVRCGQQAFVILCLVYVFVWNLATLEYSTYNPWLRGKTSFSVDSRAALDFLRLDQHWGLFAPYPRTSDGWYVVVGKKGNSDEIDFLQDDNELTWKKPADVSGSYKTFRWRKYFRNIRRKSKRRNLQLYSDYVCRAYNEMHSGEEELRSVSVYFMKRRTLRKGGHKAPKKKLLRRHACRSAPTQKSRERTDS